MEPLRAVTVIQILLEIYSLDVLFRISTKIDFHCCKCAFINSPLLRCSTARGSNSGLSLGGPSKVKAHKSFLFIEHSTQPQFLNLNFKSLAQNHALLSSALLFKTSVFSYYSIIRRWNSRVKSEMT